MDPKNSPGDGTGRYSGEITKKLWRTLNNKRKLAHFLLSCREGHPSDDKIPGRGYTISNISSPVAAKQKASYPSNQGLTQ